MYRTLIETKNNSYQGKSGQNAEADPSGGDLHTGSLQNAKPSPGSEENDGNVTPIMPNRMAAMDVAFI